MSQSIDFETNDEMARAKCLARALPSGMILSAIYLVPLTIRPEAERSHTSHR
jgi:hypothetical protein